MFSTALPFQPERPYALKASRAIIILLHVTLLVFFDRFNFLTELYVQEKVMSSCGTWIDWQYLFDASSLLAKVTNDIELQGVH